MSESKPVYVQQEGRVVVYHPGFGDALPPGCYDITDDQIDALADRCGRLNRHQSDELRKAATDSHETARVIIAHEEGNLLYGHVKLYGYDASEWRSVLCLLRLHSNRSSPLDGLRRILELGPDLAKSAP